MIAAIKSFNPVAPIIMLIKIWILHIVVFVRYTVLIPIIVFMYTDCTKNTLSCYSEGCYARRFTYKLLVYTTNCHSEGSGHLMPEESLILSCYRNYGDSSGVNKKIFDFIHPFTSRNDGLGIITLNQRLYSLRMQYNI